ncbi:MAG: stage III sporulation protein AC [Clostridiales bacterium]|jgi:stage III sporulation protein AC|nr:stage III sporulation protein AC [Clostridiales bacterium]
MSVDIIFKIAAIGILVSVLNHVLNRAGREEISMMVTLAGIVVVLLMVIDMISNLFNNIKSIFQLY